MKAVEVKTIGIRESDGKRIVEAFIVSDDTPSPLPIDGTNVDGLTSEHIFAPLSILYIVGDADKKVYIANESGIFIPQGGN